MLSRNVDGGFPASRAAMRQFTSAPPLALRDLGRLPIRGRADGVEVVGIDASASAGPAYVSGDSVTRNPSFGFGIGHICQSGV
jgi:hypothetical protein